MLQYLEILIVITLSGFKFITANVMAMGFQLNFPFAIGSTVTGGMVGVALFAYLSHYAFAAYIFVMAKFGRTVTQRRFTRTSRRIIRIKQNGGLLAIALLTPVLFTIPLGTIAAVGLGFRKQQVFLAMFLSLLSWSAALQGLSYLMPPEALAFVAGIFNTIG